MAVGAELASASTGIILSEYRDRPIEFAFEKLGVELTKEQCQIALSVRDNQETNVQSCHGVGKTILSAVLLLWWVFCVGGLCVTTAPTNWLVKDQLWQKTLNFYEKIKPEVGGQLDALQLKVKGKLRAKGFASSKTNQSSNQGFHEEYLLVIIEEACGVSRVVDHGLSSCITGSENRILRVGNPVEPQTPFHEYCTRSHIQVSAWSHPNVVWAYELHDDGIHRLKPEVAALICREGGKVIPQEDWDESLPRDIYPGAISVGWIENVARLIFYEKSAAWYGRVEGIFPEDPMDVLLPMSSLKAARARFDAEPEKWLPLDSVSWRWGMDVGDGGDPSAFAGWRGKCLMKAWELPGKGDLQDVNRTGEEGIRVLEEYGGVLAGDRAGVGAGAVGAVRSRFCFQVQGVHWASSPTNYAYRPDEYVYSILKAQHGWALREALRDQSVAIAPLGSIESKVLKELSSIRYWINPKDQIEIESKSKLIASLGHSSNLADAVLLGFNARLRSRL